jgi:predicted nucleic acid-binding protein
MYLLDTNAIVYFVSDEKDAVEKLLPILTKPIPLYISTITEAELFAYAKLSNEEAARIESLLATITAISLDSAIARTAGDLRASYQTPLADSVIAATALATGSTVLTRKVKDFKRISDLKIKKI